MSRSCCLSMELKNITVVEETDREKLLAALKQEAQQFRLRATAAKLLRLDPEATLASGATVEEINEKTVELLGKHERKEVLITDCEANLRACTPLCKMEKKAEVLADASADLKQDRELVLAAVTLCGSSLCHASSSMKNDRVVVAAAVQQNGACLCYAAKNLLHDSELGAAAVEQGGLFTIDPEACVHPVQALQNNRGVVLALVNKDIRQLQYASEELKDDRDLAIVAVKKSSEALKFVSPALRRDSEVLQAALETDMIGTLEYAGDGAQWNEDIQKAIVSSKLFSSMGTVDNIVAQTMGYMYVRPIRKVQMWATSLLTVTDFASDVSAALIYASTGDTAEAVLAFCAIGLSSLLGGLLTSSINPTEKQRSVAYHLFTFILGFLNLGPVFVLVAEPVESTGKTEADRAAAEQELSRAVTMLKAGEFVFEGLIEAVLGAYVVLLAHLDGSISSDKYSGQDVFILHISLALSIAGLAYSLFDIRIEGPLSGGELGGQKVTRSLRFFSWSEEMQFDEKNGQLSVDPSTEFTSSMKAVCLLQTVVEVCARVFTMSIFIVAFQGLAFLILAAQAWLVTPLVMGFSSGCMGCMGGVVLGPLNWMASYFPVRDDSRRKEQRPVGYFHPMMLMHMLMTSLMIALPWSSATSLDNNSAWLFLGAAFSGECGADESTDVDSCFPSWAWELTLALWAVASFLMGVIIVYDGGVQQLHLCCQREEDGCDEEWESEWECGFKNFGCEHAASTFVERLEHEAVCAHNPHCEGEVSEEEREWREQRMLEVRRACDLWLRHSYRYSPGDIFDLAPPQGSFPEFATTLQRLHGVMFDYLEMQGEDCLEIRGEMEEAQFAQLVAQSLIKDHAGYEELTTVYIGIASHQTFTSCETRFTREPAKKLKACLAGKGYFEGASEGSHEYHALYIKMFEAFDTHISNTYPITDTLIEYQANRLVLSIEERLQAAATRLKSEETFRIFMEKCKENKEYWGSAVEGSEEYTQIYLDLESVYVTKILQKKP